MDMPYSYGRWRRGDRYPRKTTELVNTLSRGVDRGYREERRSERYYYQNSDSGDYGARTRGSDTMKRARYSDERPPPKKFASYNQDERQAAPSYYTSKIKTNIVTTSDTDKYQSQAAHSSNRAARSDLPPPLPPPPPPPTIRTRTTTTAIPYQTLIPQTQKYQTPASQTEKYHTPAPQTHRYQTPASQTPRYQTPASQTEKYQTPSPQTHRYQAPHSQTHKYQTPASQTEKYQTPASQTEKYQAPASQTQKYQTPASQTQKYQTPASQTQKYQTPVSQTQKYQTPVSQTQKYQTPASQTQKYQTPAPQPEMYLSLASQLEKYKTLAPIAPRAEHRFRCADSGNKKFKDLSIFSRFFILKHAFTRMNSPSAVLHDSSCFSGIPVHYYYQKSPKEVVFKFVEGKKVKQTKREVECTLVMKNVEIAKVTCQSQKASRRSVAEAALKTLSEYCYIIEIMSPYKGEEETSANPGAEAIGKQPKDKKKLKAMKQITQPVKTKVLLKNTKLALGTPLADNCVGKKMLQQMGWSGGGLGKEGKGILEPIRLGTFGRKGLGHTGSGSKKKDKQNDQAPLTEKFVSFIKGGFQVDPNTVNTSMPITEDGKNRTPEKTDYKQKFISFNKGGIQVGLNTTNTNKSIVEGDKAKASEKMDHSQKYISFSKGGYQLGSNANTKSTAGEDRAKTSGKRDYGQKGSALSSKTSQASQASTSSFEDKFPRGRETTTSAKSYSTPLQKQSLATFFLVKLEYKNNLPALSILETSSSFSDVPLDFSYHMNGNIIECKLAINSVVVAFGSAITMNRAKEAAANAALESLHDVCYTLKVRKPVEEGNFNGWKSSSNTEGISRNNSWSDNDIRFKIMRELGWAGQGQDSEGRWITEPVRLHELSKTDSQGVSPTFMKGAHTLLREYFYSSRNRVVAFSPEFSKQQQFELSKIANLYNLKSNTCSSGRDQYLVVSRIVSAKYLISTLLKEGPSDMYQVIPPSS